VGEIGRNGGARVILEKTNKREEDLAKGESNFMKEDP